MYPSPHFCTPWGKTQLKSASTTTDLHIFVSVRDLMISIKPTKEQYQ